VNRASFVRQGPAPTARQQEALELVAQGLTFRQVGHRMGGISHGSVAALVANAEGRLGTRIDRRPRDAGKGWQAGATVEQDRQSRSREIDEALAAQPECRRCGLRGSHECLTGDSHARQHVEML